MNHIEAITTLAQLNARHFHPLPNADAIPTGIPYFQILPDTTTRRLTTRAYAYEHHDNAPRMQLWQDYLTQAILPNLSSDAARHVCGFYPIELHDAYTYLEDRPANHYKGVLTWAKFKHDTGPILLPDPYMISNWGGQVVQDTTPFLQKQDRVTFYGTTTGNRDPVKNHRIQWCLWAAPRAPIYDFKLTHVAQMTLPQIVQAYGQAATNAIFLPHRVTQQEQLANRYHMVLDGNTCRFDIWNYHTHCLSFKQESKEMLWYYPLLRNKEHFVEVNQATIDTHRQYYNANPQEAVRITQNAQALSKELFRPVAHMLYTTTLFETMAANACD